MQKPDLGSENYFCPSRTLHGKLGLLAWLYKLFLESHSELRILCYGHSPSLQYHLKRGFTFICMQ